MRLRLLLTLSLNFILFCALLPDVYAQNDTSFSEDQLVRLNDTSFLFKNDTIYELWLGDRSLDVWKLNDFTEILTYDNNQLRIWRQGNRMGLWFYAREINDWRMYETKEFDRTKLNDSLEYVAIDDTTRLLYINKKPKLCYTTPGVFIWNMAQSAANYLINDTVDIQKVNDTVNLWKSKDSVKLWYLDKTPKLWKVSSSTIVWSIDANTEFWRAGKNYRLWRRATSANQWTEDEKLSPKRLNEQMNYWEVSPEVMIWSGIDSVQIWQVKKDKKIWKLGDSLLVWTIQLPKPDTATNDTAVKIIRKVKKSTLWDLDKSSKIWTVNDSTKLYKTNKKTELWRLNNEAKLWKLSDSTLIWSLNANTKLSMISDSITVWLKNDSTFEWNVDSLVKPKRLNDSLLVLNINDSLRCTKMKDSTAVWHSSSSAKIATQKNIKAFLRMNDTTELWEPNDSVKLWIDTYGADGKVWERNKNVNILNINDSTKIWQLNDNVRLSIINGKLKIWQQGSGDPYLSWKESRGFQQDKIGDTIKIWHIDDRTIIWETHHKIEVWNKNDKLELYRLNDTSLVWTYSAAMLPPPVLKPKYWTFLGTGKMDIAQVWVDQWVKGGENSLSTLFILNFQANYKKLKVRWDNDFEYRYGFLRAGDAPIRKNEDKIKANSVFNYYAFKKWYYGFTSTLQTQFFKGYKYESDTSYVVSDLAAPLYYTTGLGLNYFPVKQFSVFFSPITNKLTYVRDTVLIDQTSYGIPADKKMKNEPGAIVKSILNWDITSNINILNKLDIFTRYDDLEKYNVEWELTLTFKFNNFINATLNTHLIYDPDISIEDTDGNTITPVQFKEIMSIGLFYKI